MSEGKKYEYPFARVKIKKSRYSFLGEEVERDIPACDFNPFKHTFVRPVLPDGFIEVYPASRYYTEGTAFRVVYGHLVLWVLKFKGLFSRKNIATMAVVAGVIVAIYRALK